MRGRHTGTVSGECNVRNTPAYAGKTFWLSLGCHIGEKHPRVCGEDLSMSRRAMRQQETPPRMRGRLVAAGIKRPDDGNTPAYAGKTIGIFFSKCTNGKHPRVCGEDSAKTRLCANWRETPPRMRGRLSCCTHVETWGGNTPAYAGKTHGQAALPGR